MTEPDDQRTTPPIDPGRCAQSAAQTMGDRAARQITVGRSASGPIPSVRSWRQTDSCLRRATLLGQSWRGNRLVVFCGKTLNSKISDYLGRWARVPRRQFGCRLPRRRRAASARKALGYPSIREEGRRAHAEGASELHQGKYPDVPLASLDSANVVPVQSRPFGELLLAQAGGQSCGPDARTHSDEVRSFGHDLGCVRPISGATHYQCD